MFMIKNNFSKFELKKQVIFITGGTSGIGLALAKKFASLQCKVIICGRNQKKLDAALKVDKNISGFTVDLNHSGAILIIKKYFSSTQISPSILINNAGIGQYMNFISEAFTTLQPHIEQEIQINMQSVMLLSAALLPYIKQNAPGAIINITSGLALAPKKSSPVYCATKAGIRSFSQSLRYQIEDAKLDIRVIEVLPPIVDTPMTANVITKKISTEQLANDIIKGLLQNKKEVYSGKTKWLKWIYYFSPSIAYKILRNF